MAQVRVRVGGKDVMMDENRARSFGLTSSPSDAAGKVRESAENAQEKVSPRPSFGGDYTNPSAMDFGFRDDPSRKLEKYMEKGDQLFQGQFGFENPEMKFVLDEWKKRASGLDQAERLALTEQGTAGINQQLATNLRGLRGLASARGVRGGAAAGMALPALAQAQQAAGNLQRDIAVEDMDRRREALNQFASIYTGERAGELGSKLGVSGLLFGQDNFQDQMGLSKDWLKQASDELQAARDMGVPGAFDAPKSWLKKQGEIIGREWNPFKWDTEIWSANDGFNPNFMGSRDNRDEDRDNSKPFWERWF